MIVRYFVNCFERELCVEFDDKYSQHEEKIWQSLEDAYCLWHSTDEIEDNERRSYVEDSCCEEFMIEEMEKGFPEWIQWCVEDDIDEDGNVIKPYYTKNKK